MARYGGAKTRRNKDRLVEVDAGNPHFPDPNLEVYNLTGLWAEYHIYDGPREIGRTFPWREFQETFFRLMDSAFQQLPWSISIDAANPEYTPFTSRPSLVHLRFGLFDDPFMHEEHDGYNMESWNFFGRDRYLRSPAGGEFSYYTSYDQDHVLDESDMHGRTFENEAAEFHISYR